jgi:hypothetical protein
LYSERDITYSEYKQLMLDRIKKCEDTEFRGMIVNRGGHPKTNTTETCYRHLRRMIKDKLIKMVSRPYCGYNHISVLIIN